MPWSDYPNSAREEARKALRFQEENQTDCGTRVGWERANQLDNGEALSDETVKRTYSFLSRSKTYDTGSFTDSDDNPVCGSIMYAAWGGDPMLRWAEATVEKIDENERQMKRNKVQEILNTNFATLSTAMLSRHVWNIEEDEESVTITFGKPGMDMAEDDERKYKDKKKKKRAEPGEVQIGDFVSWPSGEGRAYGRVEEVATENTVVADSGFEIEGTPDDPAALISIYDRLGTDEFARREPSLLVAHRVSTLRLEDPAMFRSLTYRVRQQKPSNQMKHVERRTYSATIEYRAEGEKPVITGYAALFDSESEDLGGFVEVIDRRAFDNTDMSDVRALFNHDPNFVLGRTTNNTLRLEVDERGLRYEITPPNTQMIRDLVLEPMRRGDVSQSSFGFTIRASTPSADAQGKITSTVTDIDRLFDVSPVTFPAYQMTEATARNIEQAQTDAQPPEEEEETEFEKKDVTDDLEYYKCRLLEIEE